MNLVQIPILQDNYVWLLSDGNHTIIIDPGVAQPVIDYLQNNGISPTAILLTHRHSDHVGGVSELHKRYPHLLIYGSPEIVGEYQGQPVKEGDRLTFGTMTLSVLDVPGHTLKHVAFYCAPYLFCGDVLFSAGCGRVFEGTHEQMYNSLMKLARLPEETLVCCAHEFTLTNLRFALSLVPEDKALKRALDETIRLRDEKRTTLPSLLGREKRINLFLRCHEDSLKQKLILNNGAASDLDLFIFIRNKKDAY